MLYTKFVPVSDEESEKYFRTINSDVLKKAADEENHEAEYWLGLRCLKVNFESGLMYLKRAADSGLAKAQYEYGRNIETKNQLEGEQYLRMALSQNNKDAQSWYALVCLDAQDLSKALHFLRMVDNKKAEVQLEIAKALNTKKSSFKSKKEIKELFDMVKDTDDPQTQFEISKYLESENNSGFESYLIKSSNHGCSDAQLVYGKRLMKYGKITEGINLIKMCADNGNAAAQFEYANYIKSYDLGSAKQYYQMSSQNGNEDALQILEWQFRQIS